MPSGNHTAKPPKPSADHPGRKANPRRGAFVKAYTDPQSPTFGNGLQSAITSGYSANTAGSIASELLKKPEVMRSIEAALERAGISDDALASTFQKGLKAKQRRVFLHQKTGEVVYSRPMVAHDIRLRSAEAVAKIRGYFPTSGEQERKALLQIQQNIFVVPGRKEEPKSLEASGREVDE